MEYILFFLIYVYVITGIFISIKLFKNIIGKLIGAVYFGLFWLPVLMAEVIVSRIER